MRQLAGKFFSPLCEIDTCWIHLSCFSFLDLEACKMFFQITLPAIGLFEPGLNLTNLLLSSLTEPIAM
jgi:hypothetical protein